MVPLSDFPGYNCPERENKILELIKNKSNRVDYYWVPLTCGRIKLQVFGDALKIDGVRINITARTKQKIADMLGATLPTARICDLIWHSADIRINPRPQSISSTTAAMINHSKGIDSCLKDSVHTEKLISTVGKYWIIDNKLSRPRIPNQACNYGWHFEGSSFQGIKGNCNQSLLKDPKTGIYWRLIQPASFHHNSSHTDYSQICILVSRQCWVNEKEMDILDVLKDPELSSLINHDGVLRVLRQPGVPEEMEPIVELPIPSKIDIKKPDLIETQWEPSETAISEEEETAIELKRFRSSGGIFAFFILILKTILSLFQRR